MLITIIFIAGIKTFITIFMFIVTIGIAVVIINVVVVLWVMTGLWWARTAGIASCCSTWMKQPKEQQRRQALCRWPQLRSFP